MRRGQKMLRAPFPVFLKKLIYWKRLNTAHCGVVKPSWLFSLLSQKIIPLWEDRETIFVLISILHFTWIFLFASSSGTIFIFIFLISFLLSLLKYYFYFSSFVLLSSNSPRDLMDASADVRLEKITMFIVEQRCTFEDSGELVNPSTAPMLTVKQAATAILRCVIPPCKRN